jgi:shikimate kinase
MKDSVSDNPNLYLMGFMGTGKSAVGRRVADHLGMTFLDSDAEIVRSEERTIEAVFATDGEAYFRRLEREFIEHGHPRTGCVVSCGGGIVTQPGVTERLRQRGVVIVLFASVETILERVSGSRRRPLLNVDDPAARISELLQGRESAYRDAGCGVSTDNRSIEEVASHVIRVFRERAG